MGQGHQRRGIPYSQPQSIMCLSANIVQVKHESPLELYTNHQPLIPQQEKTIAVPYQMARVPWKWQHMGTSWPCPGPNSDKTISLTKKADSYKNPATSEQKLQIPILDLFTFLRSLYHYPDYPKYNVFCPKQHIHTTYQHDIQHSCFCREQYCTTHA
jgi:hypothetical protein